MKNESQGVQITCAEHGKHVTLGSGVPAIHHTTDGRYCGASRFTCEPLDRYGAMALLLSDLGRAIVSDVRR